MREPFGRCFGPLLLAIGLWAALSVPAAAQGVPEAAAPAQALGPGGVRERFAAWEKRVRKFEVALDASLSPSRYAAVAARLESVAANIQAESEELAERHRQAVRERFKALAPGAAVAAATRELGYGPDELAYARNVAAYAQGLRVRLRARAPSAAGTAAPGPPSASGD